jgi:adenine-specific DNA-methyltransferase
MNEFNRISVELMNTIKPAERKKNGIFFTPKTLRSVLITELKKNYYIGTGQTLLEPSMGSGEFVEDLYAMDPHAKITGIELVKEIFDESYKRIKPLSSSIDLINRDFMEYPEHNKFDFIIGNPPYSQITKDKDIFREKYPQLQGKFDLFIIFILKCVAHLKPNGRLFFIIPHTFMATFSYNNVRQFIGENYTIENIIDLPSGKWIGTNQKTIGITIVASEPTENSPFVWKINDIYMVNFKESVLFLENFLKSQNGQTIQSHGFVCKTGEIVWNEQRFKKLLTNDSSKPILVHNSYLKKNKLQMPTGVTDRHLFIDYDNYVIDRPVILMNRGNGNCGNMKLEIVYVDPLELSSKIIVENHIYKIYGLEEDKEALLGLYNHLLKPDTQQFIRYCSLSGFLTIKFINNIPYTK